MAVGHTANSVFCCFVGIQPLCFIICYSSVTGKMRFSPGIS